MSEMEQSYLKLILSEYDLSFLKPKNQFYFSNDQPTQQNTSKYQGTNPFSIKYGVENQEYLQFQFTTSFNEDPLFSCGVDLLFLIDRSKMMTDKMMKTAKVAISQVLQNMGPNDRISLIQFNEQTDRLLPFVHVNNENRGLINGIVESITTRGSCHILPALMMADCCLKYRKYLNQPASIFIITNGQDFTRCQINITKLFSNNKQLSINVYSLAPQPRQHVINLFEKLRKGYSIFVDNLKELPKILLLSLATIQQTILYNLKMTIKSQKFIYEGCLGGGGYNYVSNSEIRIERNSVSVGFLQNHILTVSNSQNEIVAEVFIEYHDVYQNSRKELYFPVFKNKGCPQGDYGIKVQEFKYRAQVDILEAIDYYDPHRVFDSKYFLEKYLKDIEELPDGMKQELKYEISQVSETLNNLEKQPEQQPINPFREGMFERITDLQQGYLEQYLREKL